MQRPLPGQADARTLSTNAKTASRSGRRIEEAFHYKGMSCTVEQTSSRPPRLRDLGLQRERGPVEGKRNAVPNEAAVQNAENTPHDGSGASALFWCGSNVLGTDREKRGMDFCDCENFDFNSHLPMIGIRSEPLLSSNTIHAFQVQINKSSKFGYTHYHSHVLSFAPRE